MVNAVLALEDAAGSRSRHLLMRSSTRASRAMSSRVYLLAKRCGGRRSALNRSSARRNAVRSGGVSWARLKPLSLAKKRRSRPLTARGWPAVLQHGVYRRILAACESSWKLTDWHPSSNLDLFEVQCFRLLHGDPIARSFLAATPPCLDSRLIFNVSFRLIIGQDAWNQQVTRR